MNRIIYCTKKCPYNLMYGVFDILLEYQRLIMNLLIRKKCSQMEIIVIIISILIFLSLLKSNISEDDIDRTVPQDSDD